jgi:succinate dehydrogenase/fumarate reductase iron-sulfur protein
MSKIKIKILRHYPDSGGTQNFEQYSIEINKNSTILEGLLQIYERYDSTLAFSFGCRVKNCGLCAVNANGKPCYACVTRIENGMEISPLNHLPLIRDLVFDREPFFAFLNRFRPYVVRKNAPETLPETMLQPPEHTILMSCRECFACMSSCQQYDHNDGSFGGPLAFVKLAQLHYDCRDSMDRALQAEQMGISKCVDCKKCACISGIPLNRIVIRLFLGLLQNHIGSKINDL